MSLLQLKCRYEEGRGRFAVAAREIKVGELIAKERPYVSLLDRELVRCFQVFAWWKCFWPTHREVRCKKHLFQVKSHCWHCLTCTKSPLPCSSCSGVQFCSRQCREAAMATYHKYECLFTDSLYQVPRHGSMDCLVAKPPSYHSFF